MYLCADDLEGAIESWKEALTIAPDSPDAHTNLASAYIMSKPPQGELALSHLKYAVVTYNRTAAELSPDDGEIQFNLATVLEACAYTCLTQASNSKKLYMHTRRRRRTALMYVDLSYSSVPTKTFATAWPS